MTSRKFLFVFLGLSFALLCSPMRSLARQQKDKPTYESLLEKVMKSDPAADFTALRLAYFDNPPKNSEKADPDADKAMRVAFREKKYDKAIEIAQEIIKGNFVDIDAHLILVAAYKEKKDTEKAKFHAYVAEGLIKSILNSGDGQSEETAYVVISTEEEYVILRVFGLMPGKQSLLNEKEHDYDMLETTDLKTKQQVKLYFNIDRPYGALKKIFSK